MNQATQQQAEQSDASGGYPTANADERRDTDGVKSTCLFVLRRWQLNLLPGKTAIFDGRVLTSYYEVFCEADPSLPPELNSTSK